MDTEEKRNELELKRIEADAVKLTKEAERMDLSNTLDKVKLVLTAVAAGAAVLVALEFDWADWRCMMFERYVQVSENIRLEREWWKLLKYGVWPAALGDRAHRDRVLALDTLTGLRLLPSGEGSPPTRSV